MKAKAVKWCRFYSRGERGLSNGWHFAQLLKMDGKEATVLHNGRKRKVLAINVLPVPDA